MKLINPVSWEQGLKIQGLKDSRIGVLGFGGLRVYNVGAGGLGDLIQRKPLKSMQFRIEIAEFGFKIPSSKQLASHLVTPIILC